jgi:hypothetical protein
MPNTGLIRRCLTFKNTVVNPLTCPAAFNDFSFSLWGNNGEQMCAVNRQSNGLRLMLLLLLLPLLLLRASCHAVQLTQQACDEPPLSPVVIRASAVAASTLLTRRVFVMLLLPPPLLLLLLLLLHCCRSRRMRLQACTAAAKRPLARRLCWQEGRRPVQGQLHVGPHPWIGLHRVPCHRGVEHKHHRAV